MNVNIRSLLRSLPERGFLPRTILFQLLAVVLVLGMAGSPSTARAQYASWPVVFSPPELEQLVAPIALYPDQLLGQVLMAATYPIEVVQAARWTRDPANASLRGAALNSALAAIDWDPSVKSLVPFPQVLDTMDVHLDWMQKLGDAFLAQQAAVMDAVQHLRRRALADGRLRSAPQQVVVIEGDVIVIHAANPELVYVPYYDPYVVYGNWPYPAYVPYYFPPPSGYYVEASLVPGFFFFAGGVHTVHWLWDWHRWDWRRRYIHIDTHRYNVIHVRRPPVKRDVWVHDYEHRRGVPYPTRTMNDIYARRRPPAAETRRDYRGNERGHRESIPPTSQRSVPPVTRTSGHRSTTQVTIPSPRVITSKPRLSVTTERANRQSRINTASTEPVSSIPRSAPRSVPSRNALSRSTRQPATEQNPRSADQRRDAARERQSRRAAVVTRSASPPNTRNTRPSRDARDSDNSSPSRFDRQAAERPPRAQGLARGWAAARSRVPALR